MSVHKRSFKNKISYIILAVVIILALLTTVFFAQLSRHISEISEFESKQAALDVINAAINRELEKLPQSSYIKISETDGRITSINSDTNAVNRLQSSVSKAVNESLSQLEGTKLSVPIGTLSGINILTGRGFDIPLRLHQIGAAKTELKSDLTEAGINQTKYSLYLTVTIEMTAILPAHSTDIVVRYDYPVSETVIIGEIPDMYLSKEKG